MLNYTVRSTLYCLERPKAPGISTSCRWRSSSPRRGRDRERVSISNAPPVEGRSVETDRETELSMSSSRSRPPNDFALRNAGTPVLDPVSRRAALVPSGLRSRVSVARNPERVAGVTGLVSRTSDPAASFVARVDEAFGTREDQITC